MVLSLSPAEGDVVVSREADMEGFAYEFTSVIVVTLVYLVLYYVFMLNVLRVKLKVVKRCKEQGERFERYAVQYPDLLAADRIQMNMLEHMPPFLAILWLQALVVSAESAAILGSIYVLLRALYPLFLGGELKSNIPMRLLLNTFSAYGVMGVMLGWTFWALVA